jgi:MFS family permease
MENIANDSILLRCADKEIRGVIYGVANACGFLGMLLFSIVGGIIFDSISPYAPFMLVGGLDLSFALLATLLSCCGVI